MRGMIVAVMAGAMLAAVMQTSPAAADDTTDIAALKAARARLDAAFAAGNVDAIVPLMTPDHIAITKVYGGAMRLAEQMATMPELKVMFSAASEPQVELLGRDAALVTYKVSLSGTFRGEPVPDRVFVSEIWVKVDDTWLEKTYQETVIK